MICRAAQARMLTAGGARYAPCARMRRTRAITFDAFTPVWRRLSPFFADIFDAYASFSSSLMLMSYATTIFFMPLMYTPPR
jgi:hypothetical protein